MTLGASAADLLLNNVAAPTVVGAGVGKRAIWTNAGTVGGSPIDLVATITEATLDHALITQNNRPAIRSVGQDNVWLQWRIFAAGTYDINTDSGGTPVAADVQVQLNDIDGPNNEQAYIPVCDGTVDRVRIERVSTLGRTFGAIGAHSRTLGVVGDQNYNQEDRSSVEVFYPNTSVFRYGRTGNNNYYLRLIGPTLNPTTTLDYKCGDFTTPLASDDTKEGVPGSPVTFNILQNDTVAIDNGAGLPSEYGQQAVMLNAPTGATGVTTDADGHVVAFTAPGEGTWSYNDATGVLTYTPQSGFTGAPTPITYYFIDGIRPTPLNSNAATVTITQPQIGIVLSSTRNDDIIADGRTQVGETITYTYQVRSLGTSPISSVALSQTSFSGAGAVPSPALQSGDTNSNGLLDAGETWIYTASYALTAADVAAGVVTYQESAGGASPLSQAVSDLSDSGNAADGNGVATFGPGAGGNDPTTTTLPHFIDAVDDTPGAINGASGQANIVNVLTNDVLTGAAATTSSVTISVITPASNANVSLDPASGNVSVAAGTPAGAYSIAYRICETADATNCDTANIAVTVTAPPIDAVDDGPAAADGSVGQANIVNVLSNDTLNGAAVGTSAVAVSIVTPASNANVSLDIATGNISVAAGTPAATYTIGYRICEILNPANCDAATVSVQINAGIIDAVDDTPVAAANGTTGAANVANVFSNDTLGGAAVNPAALTATVFAATDPKVSLNTTTGQVSVAADTPAGAYSINYRICETINPANCDTATVTVSVVAGAIDAVDDTPAAVGGEAGAANAGNAFANDMLGGAAVNASKIIATVTTPPANAGVKLDVSTGVISADPGTPAGAYTIGYRLCEAINPTNCDTALVAITVNAAAITAANDTPAGVNGSAANANVVNVFSNDTLGGGAIVPSKITLTVVTPATSPNIALDTSTGIVSFTGPVAAGSYSIDYRICENLNPSNCATATVSLQVTAGALSAANDNPPAAAGTAGDPNVVNVLSNDTLNGAPVSSSSVSVAIVTPPTNTGVQLDTSTGVIAVAANTPAGVYGITYRICELFNPANCATATATVTVTAATISAVNDAPPAVSGSAANSNVVNVFANDTLGGLAVTPSAITLTVLTAATNPNIALDTATGVVSLTGPVAAGSYVIDYRICENLNPSNCDDATATLQVTAGALAAANDDPASANGIAGEPNVINVLANDTLNGVPVTPAEMTLSIVTPAASANVRLDTATGIVSVAPNTPAGAYTIVYRVCEAINPANCSTATITVNVNAATIAALNDNPPALSGSSGDPNVIDAFANDTVNGTPVSSANITATVVTPASNPNVALDTATGVVSVSPNTPAGTYSIVYQLCEVTNPTVCDQAVITVRLDPAPIDAVDDAPAAVAGVSATPNLVNAFANDTLNGALVTSSNVTATIVTPASNPNVTMNAATGVVSVAAGTPAGTYTITYRLCEALNPANCDTASVTATVTAAVIDAVDDASAAVNGTAGAANAVNVYANDTLSGAAISPATITGSVVSPAGNAGVTLDPTTGRVSVAAATPAGTYAITYRICENLNAANCDIAIVSIVVNAGAIDAVDDAPPAVSGAAGAPNVANAYANDTLNGAPVNPGAITASVVTPASNAGITLNPATGQVTVAAATPAGTYTIIYRICENLNSANCDNASIAVVVSGATLIAADDAPAAVNGATGAANVINAFANDTLDGAMVNASTITGSVLVPATNTGVALDAATGRVSVAAGTPAGSYSITYRICEALNPGNCDDAVITVPVNAATVGAVNDAPPAVVGDAGSPNLANVLANDTVDGAPASASSVSLTIVTPASNPGVGLDTATGVLSVQPGVPAGVYTIGYSICEALNPSNCATASVSISVTAATVVAGTDTIPPVNGATGSTNAGNVLANDTLNGQPAVPPAVTVTITAPPANSGVALNTATGVISVQPGTPGGTYTIGYQVCETINPMNCTASMVSVQVIAPQIRAVDDAVAGAVDTAGPLVGVIDVLTNDTLGGAAIDPTKVTVTPIGTLPAGFTLNPNGTVDIAAFTPSGAYAFDYRVCESGNPTNCATAHVAIPVKKSVPAVSGTVYFDQNGNGAIDAGDTRLGGYTVELRRDGGVVATAITGQDGAYRIEDFPPGSGYEVVFIDPKTSIAVGRIADVTFANNTNLTDQNKAIDPSGVIYNSSTGAPLAGVTITLTDASNTPLPAICLLPGQQGQTTGADGGYRFDLNAGAAGQCPVAETEYHLVIIGYPAGVQAHGSVIAPPQAGALDATTCPVDAVPGGACQLSASILPPAPGAPTPYYLVLLLAAGDPDVVNNHIALDAINAVPASGITITKRANVAVIRRDEVATYVIVASNSNTTAAGQIDIQDRLPADFAYVPNSATVDGLRVEPAHSARALTFTGLTIPAQGSVEIHLAARVGADVKPGDHINEALVVDPATGKSLSAVARATVRVIAEHVFDCGEIIGKVFDDRNRDGSQDEGEKGLPAVRVVTVNGLLITTDRYGRFSVPCAELPDQSIGSNFILKLDTRTLPDGFGLTTENPMVVRLTAGKVTKLNFGATVATAVKIQLTGRAFRKGAGEPTGELRAGIGQLAGIADKRGSSLKITYKASGEPPDLIKLRVKQVRTLVAGVWRDKAKALPFEILVVGSEQSP